MTDDAPDFDWKPDDPSIIVKSQPALAVYQNPHGAIVVRQEGQYHPAEDQFVYVQPENAEALAAAINALARELLSGADVQGDDGRAPAPRQIQIADQRSSSRGKSRQLDAFNGHASA